MRRGPDRTHNGFQPTRPLRGATEKFQHKRADNIFQPTRPLRGATISSRPILATGKISTHAPLAGRDRSRRQPTQRPQDFNPRAPCGARLRDILTNSGSILFQPTRPLRGATCETSSQIQAQDYFNPRAPCGARPTIRTKTTRTANFNPRAPCGARQQKCTNHYAHFCDNRQISDAFAQNAACQGILLLFDAGKPCGFWVRTAQVISARLCFAL